MREPEGRWPSISTTKVVGLAVHGKDGKRDDTGLL